jgi:Uma2 family endonuclease
MAIRRVRSSPADWRSPYDGERMSEARYLALPEEKPYLEYVDGAVRQKPMPNADHGDLIQFLALELGLWARSFGGKVRPEMRSALGSRPDYRLPDLAYWLPGRPSGDDSIPTLTIEVRSPGQSMRELRAKCHFYRQSGVEAAWLIDPASRTVEVFERDLDGARLDETSVLTSPLLPGFELPLKQLFAALD